MKKFLYSSKYPVFIALVMTSIMIYGCKRETKGSQVEKEMKSSKQEILKVTHYYSVKLEGEEAVRDTIKECFSCNQAEVYDAGGMQVALRFYKANMTDMYGYEVYTYDNNGNKTGSSYYEKDSLTTKYVYELDQKGRIYIGRAINPVSGDTLYGYKNEYDDRGNHIVTASMNGKDEILDYYRRTFNEGGVAITENIEDTEGNITFRVRYEYRPAADSTWVEQLTFYNDKLSEIRYREEITNNQ